MHLISKQAEAKLRANRLAWDHFEKYKGTYIGYAKTMKELTGKFAGVRNSESQVAMVKALILELDPNIWGLALANPILNGEQIAECFARMVVGHDEG